jgi:hypothetical protein
MVAVENRAYIPPSIGDQTPDDIFEYDWLDGLTYIRQRTRYGWRVTPNVAVFIDGACPNNGKSWARAGMGVYFGEDSPYNIS